MSQIRSKRHRTSREIGSSSHSQPSNTLLSRGGKQGTAGKKTILRGYYLCMNEIEGTPICSLIRTQRWEQFLEFHDLIYKDWVHYFYEHVNISLRNQRLVQLSITFGGRVYKYTNKDFEDDFGLESNGFVGYADSGWPEGLPNHRDVTSILNNFKGFSVDEVGLKDSTVPHFSLFTGDDRFATLVIKRAIVPTGSQDLKINKINAALLYKFKRLEPINLPFLIGTHMSHEMTNSKATTLPYGMLITHIMRKWGFMPSGEPSMNIKVRSLGVSTWKRQRLILYNGHLLSDWEIRNMTPEERHAFYAAQDDGEGYVVGNDANDDNDVNDDNIGVDMGDNVGDTGGEEIQQEALGQSITRADFERMFALQQQVLENQQDIKRDQYALKQDLKSIARTQKKQGKFLKGLKKFLCLGKNETSSSAAQHLVDYSDSEPEMTIPGEQVTGADHDSDDGMSFHHGSQN